MSEPSVSPASSVKEDVATVLSIKQSREALAYTPTAVLGALFLLSLVDMARGLPVKNSALLLDGASSFFTGICGASNISFAENRQIGPPSPTELGLVIFTNVITDGVLLANAVFNGQGGILRQAPRSTMFLWNIVSASILLNEDKIGLV
jgi:hypothetical protein